MEQLRNLWGGVQGILDFGLFMLRGGEFTISNLLGVLVTILSYGRSPITFVGP